MNLKRDRIIKAVITFFLWVIAVIGEDYVKSVFSNIKLRPMSTYLWVVIIIGIVIITGMFVFWYFKDLNAKIDNLNTRVKFMSAGMIENNRLNRLSSPERQSLIDAGVTPSDLQKLGFSIEEILALFPETKITP